MPGTHADVILTGAEVVTLDPALPSATAVALGQGNILGVGSAESLASLRGAGTEMRDLRGAVVLPGLHDIHAHHALAGHAQLSELVIDPAASVGEILDAVAERAATTSAETWIVGGNWAMRLLDELEDPTTLRRLDHASGGHPVLLRDASQHNRLANSVALGRAGIDASTADPAAGSIRRGPDGTPTGVLFESAGLLVERARDDAPTAAESDAASASGVAVLSRYGITAFQDAGVTLPILQSLNRLDERGTLDAWVVACMLANDPIFGADPVGEPLMAAAGPLRSAHVRPDFVKVFLDGVPSTRTAAFFEPYLGGGDRGETILSLRELTTLLRTAAGFGMAAKIHCTGDAAVRVALDAIEALGDDRAPGPGPYQIAHGQFVDPADLERFAALGVVADASPPLWFPGAITAAVARVHPAPAHGHAQPLRMLLDSGARIAAGSDWPVAESPDPWIGMQGLVTREDPTGRFPGSVAPDQALTPAEALAAYTSWSAAAMGLDGITGVIRVGASADLTVVDRDPTRVDPTTIAATRVHETWFAGRLVHEAA